jgi:hypothetical protein
VLSHDLFKRLFHPHQLVDDGTASNVRSRGAEVRSAGSGCEVHASVFNQTVDNTGMSVIASKSTDRLNKRQGG